MESALRQTDADFEVLVVDDASTDGGLRAARAINTGPVRCLSQPHRGPGAARNRGITEARGEWIAFLDADDLYLPEFLSTIRAAIRRCPPAGVVYTRIQWQAAPDDALPPETPQPARLLPDYFKHVVRHRGPEITSSSVAVRRDLFEAAGLFPENILAGEDSDMWFRLACCAPVAFVPRTLAIYRRWAGQLLDPTLDPTPFWMTTCRAWLRDGRVPPPQRASVRAYVKWTQLGHAIAQARRAGRAQAWRTLGGTLGPDVPVRALLKTALILASGGRLRRPRWFPKAT